MAPAAGTNMGPYEILGPLGAGGMGEVYRARDTRLSRNVAIKVLPAAFAKDPERRARFEREAKVVAALSHPNILAIHDIGETPEPGLFVVTELLEGQTLRERLTADGTIPLRKTIEIGIQIAHGLAAAHDKGIVHRDLKPENIFLLTDGHVKILDFGLARQAPTESSATATGDPVTDPGIVMGTLGYMSPEQVRGQAVDARTDLFALGAVLYEMLSGNRAFRRDTPAETMTAILREDPPELSVTRRDFPLALDRIVRHCLEKNPAERFQTARDVAFALETFSGTSGSAPVTAGKAAKELRRHRLLAFVIATSFAFLVGAMIVGLIRNPASTVVTYTPKTLDPQWITNARFAPDGQTIFFSGATAGGIPQLFVLRPDAISPEPLGEPGTHLLAVSSKGELAAITSAESLPHRLFSGTLARMTMDGAAKPWMEGVREADWSPDGATLAVIRIDGNSDRLEYPPGKLLYPIEGGYLSDPRVSPDGTKVAFFEHPVRYDNRGSVKVVDGSGKVTVLTDGYFAVEGLTWSADGRHVFYGASTGGLIEPLMVNVTGTLQPRPVTHNAGGMLVFDSARDGRLLVSTVDVAFSIRALVPGEAEEREFPWLSAAIFGFISADNRTLVFSDESLTAGPNYSVASRPVAGGKVVRLGPGSAARPSPDGRWVPGLAPSGDGVVLYPTGTGEPRKLPKGPIAHYEFFFEWFPDGRAIVCGTEAGKMSRCYAQDVPDGVPAPITPEGVRESRPSPDGKKLLVTTTQGEHGLVTLGESSSIVPVAGVTAQEDAIAWTRDGRGIVVSTRTAPAKVFRVDIVKGERTLLRELAPPDRTGVAAVYPTQWIDDGRGYAYTYYRALGKLFVASGVKP